MQKSTLTRWFIAASAAYILYVHVATQNVSSITLPVTSRQSTVTETTPASSTPIAANATPPPNQSARATTSGSQTSSQTKKSATPPPVAAPAPKPKPTGMYADGTYIGGAADAYYGTVQVQADIQNGRLASVEFLQHPSDRRTSQFINGQAMPILTNEAVQSQSANVDIVSGATDTSMAFQQSLADALAKARA